MTTCLAYMYRMLEIANHVDMEEEAKVEYIINGIVDEEVNKSTLYGAASIKELRNRLITYEDQESRRTKSIAKPAKIEKRRRPSRSGGALKTRCYNCGDEEHVCAECPNKSRGRKCFKCRGHGHIASKCNDLGKTSKEVYNARKLLQASCKSVGIRNFELSALIDSGSDLTLMRADQYVRIRAPKLRREIVEFRSIVSERNFALGKFSTNIVIDDESYYIMIH